MIYDTTSAIYREFVWGPEFVSEEEMEEFLHANKYLVGERKARHVLLKRCLKKIMRDCYLGE